jgi:hypothetical protein
MAGAIGVCVAAIYYVINLRETRRNRTLAFTTSISQRQLSDDWMQKMAELFHMEWKDFDDFRTKYDSHVNLDNYVKRNIVFGTFDFMGYMLKRDLVDRDIIYQIAGEMAVILWIKFGPIIQEYRRLGDFAADTFTNFEDLAAEMAKIKREKDPTWISTSLFSEADYNKAFKDKTYQNPP